MIEKFIYIVIAEFVIYCVIDKIFNLVFNIFKYVKQHYKNNVAESNTDKTYNIADYLVYTDPNPVNQDKLSKLCDDHVIYRNDCLVCAVSNFFEIPWKMSYNLIASCGRDYGLIMNSVNNTSIFLEKEMGLKRIYSYRSKKCIRQHNIFEFLNKKQYKTGKFLFEVYGHIVYVKDGKIYDASKTYNYNDFKVYRVWTEKLTYYKKRYIN